MESDQRPRKKMFLCFTCSSSKEVSSGSNRSRRRKWKLWKPFSSISCCITRRSRSNGSMKSSSQVSRMFSTRKKKKKSSSFEPAEPSSPKVSCIGQVRVKTKKHGQKMRRRSKSRRRGVGSNRKTEQIQEGNLIHHHQQQQQQECLNRNQRWVHIPLSICEALRAFGDQISCLFPCRPACCWSRRREKVEKKRNRERIASNTNSSSCWTMCGRCGMSTYAENEEDKRRDMSLVREEEMRVERRKVVDEMEMRFSEENRVIYSNEIEEEEDEDEDEDDEGRLSICSPPRNALLLMRCRSDPLKMSSLANRFWESPVNNKEEEEEKKDEVEDSEDEDNKNVEKFAVAEEEDGEDDEVKREGKKMRESPGEEKKIHETLVKKEEEKAEETPKLEEIEENLERENAVMNAEEEKVESRRGSFSSRRVSVSSCTGSLHTEEEPEPEPMVDFEERVEEEEEEEEEETIEVKGTTEEGTSEDQDLKATQVLEREINQKSSTVKQISYPMEEDKSKLEERENSDDLLPDCLLLMMREPKLSMEVSKETWVCSKDFIRFHPERKVIQKKGGDEQKKRLSNAGDEQKKRLSNGGDESKKRLSNGGDDSRRRLSTDSNPGRPPLPAHRSKNQTPRRSLSKPSPSPPPPPQPAPSEPPAPPEQQTKPSPLVVKPKTLEPELVKGGVHQPLVLTRCKSEPMRSSVTLAPEACFWKNMKLEPHAQGSQTIGVGATGVGF